MANRIQPRTWLKKLDEWYAPTSARKQGLVVLLSGQHDDLFFIDAVHPKARLHDVLFAHWGEALDLLACYYRAEKSWVLEYKRNLLGAATANPIPAPRPAQGGRLERIESLLEQDQNELDQQHQGRTSRECSPSEALHEIDRLLKQKAEHGSVILFEDVYWHIEQDQDLDMVAQWARWCRENNHLVIFALRRDLNLPWLRLAFGEGNTRSVEALTVDGPTKDEIKASFIYAYLQTRDQFFDWRILDALAEHCATHYTIHEKVGLDQLVNRDLPDWRARLATLRQQSPMLNHRLDQKWLDEQPKPGQKAEPVFLNDVILKPAERAYFEFILRAWRDPEWFQREAARLKIKVSEIEVPTRILLYGPPGTGKTTIAKMFATESRRNFFNVTAADFTSEYRGKPLILVQEQFKKWRANAPCVVFWDEVESVAARRQDSQHSDNPINQILTELESAEGKDRDIVIICATNIPEKLDPAFRRRFQEGEFLIGYPDQEGRTQLVQKYFQTHLFKPDLQISQVAGWFDKRSPSDIKACGRACLNELSKEGKEQITRDMILRWLANHPLDEELVKHWQQQEEKFTQRMHDMGIV